MKKMTKTVEEVRRDQLVVMMIHHKDTLTARVKDAEQWQMAQSVLPTDCQEYKDVTASLAYAKWDVVHAMRDYEDTRKELCAFCSQHHLSGDRFIPAVDLIKSVCYYRHN